MIVFTFLDVGCWLKSEVCVESATVHLNEALDSAGHVLQGKVKVIQLGVTVWQPVEKSFSMDRASR